jgi:hypothetical protein
MLPDQERHNRIRRSLALALNHEWPQLERTRKHVAKLPAVRILDEPATTDMPIVATVATDGGEGRLSLAPISIQIVRVADNRGVVHFEEFVPQSLRPDEVMRYFFASDERFQRFLRYLGVSLDDLLPESDFQKSHLLAMLRELLEWAALLKLAAHPYLSSTEADFSHRSPSSDPRPHSASVGRRLVPAAISLVARHRVSTGTPRCCCA